MNVKEIIKKAGGDIEISYKYKIHQTNISAWQRRGIPQRYWSDLAEMAGITIEDIYRACEAAKNDK